MKSDKNYFVCNRSLFKNPLWYSEKFTKGQAWVDLFGNANHSPGWFEKNGQRVDIKRGQTGRSIETLATDWKWSRNKVKRFLKRLIDERMIDHETNHLTSIITICNYDEYQFPLKEGEPPHEPSLEPSLEPQTIKKKERKKEEINKYNDSFLKLWDDYPNTSGSKTQTFKNYKKTKKVFSWTDDKVYQAAINMSKKNKYESKTKDVFYYQLSNVLGEKYRNDLPEMLNYQEPEYPQYSNREENPMPKEFL